MSNNSIIATLGSSQLFYVGYYVDSEPYRQNFNRHAIYSPGITKHGIPVQVGRGKIINIDLKNKQADFIKKTYLTLKTPKITIPTNIENWKTARFAWQKNFAINFIKEFHLKVASTQMTQKIFGIWTVYQNELLYPFNKQELISDLSGNTEDMLSYSSPDSNGVIKLPKLVSIDLPLTYSGDSKDALPVFILSGVAVEIEIEFIPDFRKVAIYNEIMKPYVDTLTIDDAFVHISGIVIKPEMKCAYKQLSNYIYIVKDIECKSITSQNQEETIKLSTGGTQNMTQFIFGVVKSGLYNAGRKFITYKYGKESNETTIQRGADRIAESMIHFHQRGVNVATVVDTNDVPIEWLGTNGSNISNIKLLNVNTGYITRSNDLISGLAKDSYLRVKVPANIFNNYDVYVNCCTMKPSTSSNQYFCFNNKIDEITVDGFLNPDLELIRYKITASEHWLDIRDMSYPTEGLIDTRTKSFSNSDVIVNDTNNSGILIDGTGHIIDSTKISLLGITHEEENHELFNKLNVNTNVVNNGYSRPGSFLISFSDHITAESWLQTGADMSKIDSAELRIIYKDTTEDYYKNSPFTIIGNTNQFKLNTNIELFNSIFRSPFQLIGSSMRFIVNEEELKCIIINQHEYGNDGAIGEIREVNNEMKKNIKNKQQINTPIGRQQMNNQMNNQMSSQMNHQMSSQMSNQNYNNNIDYNDDDKQYYTNSYNGERIFEKIPLNFKSKQHKPIDRLIESSPCAQNYNRNETSCSLSRNMKYNNMINLPRCDKNCDMKCKNSNGMNCSISRNNIQRQQNNMQYQNVPYQNDMIPYSQY